MSLNDLPARELARLDAVCLGFENALRNRSAATEAELDIEALVRQHGGRNADLLRHELIAIVDEIGGNESSRGSDTIQQNHSLTSTLKNPIAAPADTPHAVTLAMESTGEFRNAEGSPERSRPTKAFGSGPSATPAPRSLPPIETRLGPYLLTSVLGQGGMGIVYRATDTRLDRSVAIKMLAVDSQHAEELADRFQREAKAVAALSHPNIVELFDVGVYESMPYAVMEHLRGESLQRRMSASRIASEPITAAMVRSWGGQLADALAAAHAAGVIHRDLKPENVMWTSGRPRSSVGTGKDVDAAIRSDGKPDAAGSLKLFDFGLSRFNASMFGPDGDDSASTRAGVILGTPGYMAPEQARGEPVTAAADVFALGCLLFEAFYGKPAFDGQSPARRYAAVLESQPEPDPIRRRDDVPLADAITRMLAKDPVSRPTAAEIVAAMTSADGTSPRTTTDPAAAWGSLPPLSRRRWVELVGGGIAGGLLGGFWFRGSPVDLRSIRSIAVLSLQPVAGTSGGASSEAEPAGNRPLLQGELLAGLLVNELSRLENISVPRYTPLQADEPAEFRDAALRLEVDALITGTFAPAPDGMIDVNLQIISGATGKVLAGLPLRTRGGEDLVDQTQLARTVAQGVGRRLAEASEVGDALDPSAFTCLVKGRTYADPDSEGGLRRALLCFEHAIEMQEDYAHALAGAALTSITLAGRSSPTDAKDLISRSRIRASQSLAIDPDHPEARLARAMLDYQTLGEFAAAGPTLTQLVDIIPNHWQAHHELGWLRLIEFDERVGIRELQLASQLHPTSLLLKTDLARAEWFRGRPDRAVDEATVLLPAPGSRRVHDPAVQFPRGLLIDIHEQSGDFAAAAAVDSELSWQPGQTSAEYFAARADRVVALPYGPYGPTLNEAILALRRTDLTDRESTPRMLARLRESQAPLLVLLLSKHPQFQTMALSSDAVESFPFLKIRAT